jgi:hypothetical protein
MAERDMTQEDLSVYFAISIDGIKKRNQRGWKENDFRGLCILLDLDDREKIELVS